MEKIPHHVSLEIVDFINKMLKKDAAERPCIEAIIYSDVFQTKAQLQKVSMPLMLSKQKLMQKKKLNQLNYEQLTPYQKKIVGAIEPELQYKKVSEKPENLPVVRQKTHRDEALATSNKFQPKTLNKGGNKVADE